MGQEDQTSPLVQVIRTPAQVVQLVPVEAEIRGGGTSAVVMRGTHGSVSGIRVSMDQSGTASQPFGVYDSTSLTAS
jgi:hypothetical protein